MKRPAPVKPRIPELQAARRFHELLRQDRARDAQWREEQIRAQVRADRKAAHLDSLVRTAEARIALCKDYPTLLAVRQMRQIVNDTTKPAQVRVKAAARILNWAE